MTVAARSGREIPFGERLACAVAEVGRGLQGEQLRVDPVLAHQLLVRPSTVYSNLSPAPLPYRWEVDEDTVRISVSYGPLDATFTGSFDDDQSFAGSWRPDAAADETVNVPYDIGGRLLS